MPYPSFVERRGERRGEQRGSARLLRNHLAQRFAPLAPVLVERLEQADAEQLLRWGARINHARSLDDVFAEGDDEPPTTGEPPQH